MIRSQAELNAKLTAALLLAPMLQPQGPPNPGQGKCYRTDLARTRCTSCGRKIGAGREGRRCSECRSEAPGPVAVAIEAVTMPEAA